MKKTNQNKIRIEKSNKDNSWIDKKYILNISEYFPKPKSLETNMKSELDLANYALKADLKNATGVTTSDFAKKTDLADDFIYW